MHTFQAIVWRFLLEKYIIVQHNYVTKYEVSFSESGVFQWGIFGAIQVLRNAIWGGVSNLQKKYVPNVYC